MLEFKLHMRAYIFVAVFFTITHSPAEVHSILGQRSTPTRSEATKEARAPALWKDQLLSYDNSFADGTWNESLSQIIRKKFERGQLNALLNGATLPGMSTFCAKYVSLTPAKKVDFWVSFFKALAYAESQFRKNARPKSGIFQLTCDSNVRNGYNCSCTNNSSFINDRRLSTDCAANIVNHWASKKTQFIQPKRTSSTYFSAMLTKDLSYQNNLVPTLQRERPPECVK